MSARSTLSAVKCLKGFFMALYKIHSGMTWNLLVIQLRYNCNALLNNAAKWHRSFSLQPTTITHVYAWLEIYDVHHFHRFFTLCHYFALKKKIQIAKLFNICLIFGYKKRRNGVDSYSCCMAHYKSYIRRFVIFFVFKKKRRKKINKTMERNATVTKLFIFVHKSSLFVPIQFNFVALLK